MASLLKYKKVYHLLKTFADKRVIKNMEKYKIKFKSKGNINNILLKIYNIYFYFKV